MKRIEQIEKIQRLIYGGFAQDDAEITFNLINIWLNEAIGVAAKTNYTDNLKLESIAYVNNSFYLTYKDLEISADEQFLWKFELPHLPFGLGASEGISKAVIKNDKNRISYPIVLKTINQSSFSLGMRNIPNKLTGYYEGKFVFIESPLVLSDYTAQVVMVSGGNSSNLQSELNIPDDYLPVIAEYLKKQLMFERTAPVDEVSDGIDSAGTSIK